MSSFDNKIVFITGAGRGIGRAIKESFEEHGAKVIAPERSALDLANPKSVYKYCEMYNDDDPDIFIHCAGLNILSGIEEIKQYDFEEICRVNLFSGIELFKRFVPEMKRNQNGKAIFISSLYGIVSKERRIAYSSSKHAIIGAVKSLALELAPYNIMVNSVAPGYVMTDMTKNNLSSDEINKLCKDIPTHRFQEEQEIADAVMFLCGSRNKSITGQVLVIDGGFLCR